jgi:hypothetical protein
MASTATKQQRARAQKKKKKGGGTGGTETPAQTPAKPAPAKTKSSRATPMREGSPAHTAMLARTSADTALKGVFGASTVFDREKGASDSDTEDSDATAKKLKNKLKAAVAADLKFDSDKLIELAEAVAEGRKLKKESPTRSSLSSPVR